MKKKKNVFKESLPPVALFYVVDKKYINSIKRNGIKKGPKPAVYLSTTMHIAEKIGEKYSDPTILVIKSEEMQKNGFSFKENGTGVWQTENIPSKYIMNL